VRQRYACQSGGRADRVIDRSDLPPAGRTAGERDRGLRVAASPDTVVLWSEDVAAGDLGPPQPRRVATSATPRGVELAAPCGRSGRGFVWISTLRRALPAIACERSPGDRGDPGGSPDGAGSRGFLRSARSGSPDRSAPPELGFGVGVGWRRGDAGRGSATGEAGVSLGQDPREDALVHGAGTLDV
jgi:hypothetical protein